MELSVTLVGLLCAATASLVTFVATKHSLARRIANVNDASDDVLTLRLSHEYTRGMVAGKSEELSKFTITYQPISELHEEWMGMKKRARLGYDMQLTYNGFPIGHETRYITHSNIEYNQENIDRLLNSEVATAISSVAQLVATRGISAKTLPRKRT